MTSSKRVITVTPDGRKPDAARSKPGPGPERPASDTPPPRRPAVIGTGQFPVNVATPDHSEPNRAAFPGEPNNTKTAPGPAKR
jgi:hypothetical protein